MAVAAVLVSGALALLIWVWPTSIDSIKHSLDEADPAFSGLRVTEESSGGSWTCFDTCRFVARTYCSGSSALLDPAPIAEAFRRIGFDTAEDPYDRRQLRAMSNDLDLTIQFADEDTAGMIAAGCLDVLASGR